ncbi:MAG: VOC family protein [Pacificimonas sp.]
MPKAILNYAELPVADSKRSKAFYEKALGWEMTSFAPTYAGSIGQHGDLGLDADTDLTAPLPNFETDDLEAMLAQVEVAGGRIVQPIFDFPGGRRFHFEDPDGHVIGIWEAAS